MIFYRRIADLDGRMEFIKNRETKIIQIEVFYHILNANLTEIMLISQYFIK